MIFIFIFVEICLQYVAIQKMIFQFGWNRFQSSGLEIILENYLKFLLGKIISGPKTVERELWNNLLSALHLLIKQPDQGNRDNYAQVKFSDYFFFKSNLQYLKTSHQIHMFLNYI